MKPEIVTTREALRVALGETRPGLVPTMGALHAGHLSLIARAANENRATVVSVFVNPTQFASEDDLERYPRDLVRDAAVAGEAGATLIFAPAVGAIYPPGFDTAVEVGALASRWEDVSRPGHLRGVATVVTILLNLVQPARAYFGEKDFQQLQVVRQLHHDLALPGEIVACATVRDVAGLALSSRNARLSKVDLARARAIPRAIAALQAAAREGERCSHRLEAAASAELEVAGITIDYLAIVDSATLNPAPLAGPSARLLLAVDVAGVRLIDNALVEAQDKIER